MANETRTRYNMRVWKAERDRLVGLIAQHRTEVSNATSPDEVVAACERLWNSTDDTGSSSR